MSQQIINIGSAPNDGTGDQLRVSFDKSNQNFTELYGGAGGVSQGRWNFNATDTNTSTAPVSGRFKTNSGNYRDATQIAIHGTSIQGINRADTLRKLRTGDIIQCQDTTVGAAWCRYNVQATPVDNGTWFQVNVTLETDGGVASGDNQEIVFVFTANKGGTGGGGNVSSSGTPTNGQLAQWTDATHIQGIDATSLNFAPINSPTFTGDPQAPTPATADNDTSIATTAFVKAAIAAGGGGGAATSISDTPPASPSQGQLWWESDTGKLFISYNDGNSQQWVAVAPAGSPVQAGAKVLIQSQTVSAAVASMDFKTGIDATYDIYEFDLIGVAPVAAAALQLRASYDGGATWKSGASDYTYAWNGWSSGNASVSSGAAASQIQLGNAINGGASPPTTAEMTVRLYRPGLDAVRKYVTFAGSIHGTAALLAIQGSGAIAAATTGSIINGIRFLMSTGNIAQGTFNLYGIKK